MALHQLALAMFIGAIAANRRRSAATTTAGQPIGLLLTLTRAS